MATIADPCIQLVLDNIETVVASEGGTLESAELREGRLTVMYRPGVNEECPECVPDHDLVRQMFDTSLKIYAPHVKDLDLL